MVIAQTIDILGHSKFKFLTFPKLPSGFSQRIFLRIIKLISFCESCCKLLFRSTRKLRRSCKLTSIYNDVDKAYVTPSANSYKLFYTTNIELWLIVPTKVSRTNLQPSLQTNDNRITTRFLQVTKKNFPRQLICPSDKLFYNEVKHVIKSTVERKRKISLRSFSSLRNDIPRRVTFLKYSCNHQGHKPH